ncbi:MAG: hypothetical protein RQ856_05050 [Candidatus Izemoplasmatales bacterium]|nr:hypothetical protein [Candidatus Izemoplasmatales bacterium]
MIKIKHTQGVISKTNEKKIPTEHFGKHSNGRTSEWYYFETQQEKDKFYADNFPPQPIEEVKEVNALLEAVKTMTAEEKEELKALLK